MFRQGIKFTGRRTAAWKVGLLGIILGVFWLFVFLWTHSALTAFTATAFGVVIGGSLVMWALLTQGKPPGEE